MGQDKSLTEVVMGLQIPKIFWYCLSFCMVSITVCFCLVVIKSQSVSVEIASTKISLSNALTDVQALYADVKKQQVELLSYKTQLEASIARQSPQMRSEIKLPEIPFDKEADREVSNKLQNIQQSLQK